MSKKLLLFAAACLILSSCGQKQDQTVVPTENNTSLEATAPETVTVTEPPVEAGTEEQEPPSQAAEEETITPLYHINKAYRVVPNEEGTETKVVLLTFDDGPKEQEMIDGLIDTLDKHKAKAIFFVNGYRVETHPELLKLIHDRGQIIGNHSWDHIDLKKESESEARKQVEEVQAIVEETIGERPRFFRPPFGSGNDQLHQIVEDNDMIYMTWSNGSLDWDSKNKNKPEAVIQNVLEQLHAGSNILMHELPWTVEALDSLLTQLEEKGYSFVDPRTISEVPEQSE
ncbi:polysaccharide deacetylase family protein [Paenibacillus sp. MSJ-6]|uniref:Polysaccharide deacetylase family protein n=2 Tax=Paenibacillus brevis TaxID=2841508 RepID=A0ABS6FTJ6_9BACL|nr:polysaccharide deacetylase family protein [Paenibacillus brevis]MBU5672733.1 polysaccharide deacetylase family protein [Paenibacillus brevis]